VKLDENLIGSYSEERQKMVDRFIKSHMGLEPSQINYNLCLAFFDCVPDQSFTRFYLNLGEGKFDHPFKEFNPLELLPVISQRSPDLQSLELSLVIKQS
jgi:hypothetical protein